MADPSPVAPAQQAMTGPMLDPAVLQSLLGTLMSGQISGLSQADLDQQQAAMHQQAADAAQQSQQASQQYTQAAEAPPAPQPTNFYDQLLGNTASVLSGNKSYQSDAQDRLQQHIRSVDAARLQNLQALKDSADNKANMAEKLGNAEIAAKSRMSAEQYASKIKVILQGAKQEHETNQLNTKGQQASDLAKQKAGYAYDLQRLRGEQRQQQISLAAKFKEDLGVTDPAADAMFQSGLTILSDGRTVMNPAVFKTAKLHDAAVKYAAKNNWAIVNDKQMAQLEDIQGARENITNIMAAIEDYLPQTAADRPFVGTWNVIAKGLQLNPSLGAFNTFRASAIKALRAMAGSGGLRLNQAEITLAVENDLPKVTDTVDVARNKMAIIQSMLEAAEDPVVSKDWSKKGEESRQSTRAYLLSKGWVYGAQPGSYSNSPTEQAMSAPTEAPAAKAAVTPAAPSSLDSFVKKKR